MTTSLPDPAEVAPNLQALTERWAGVEANGRAAFAEMALLLLVNLNDASATRYGLRPSEFDVWRERFTPRAENVGHGIGQHRL